MRVELSFFHGAGRWGGEGEICCCVKEGLQEGRAEVLCVVCCRYATWYWSRPMSGQNWWCAK